MTMDKFAIYYKHTKITVNLNEEDSRRKEMQRSKLNIFLILLFPFGRNFLKCGTFGIILQFITVEIHKSCVFL